MNKNDLVAHVADTAGLSKTDAAGRGRGLRRHRIGPEEEARSGWSASAPSRFPSGRRPRRNPRTGEPIKIPASRQPKFKPGKTLKDALN